MEHESRGDQRLLADTCRSFLTANSPIAAARALADDPLGYDRQVWRDGASLGWTSLLVSENNGGGSVSGDGLADAALVAYELGRVLAPGPFVPVNVVAATLGGANAPTAHPDELGALLTGRATAAFVPVGLDGTSTVRINASALPGGRSVSGVASPVEDGVGAAWILVSGPDEHGGMTQLLVPTSTPGVVITPLDGLDLNRRFARVRFDEAIVPADAIVGDATRAEPTVMRQGLLASVLQCAETLGALDVIFARTLAYLADRYSFGRPLNSYQALKHRCADDALALQRCHATVGAACRAVSANSDNAAELVSIAKAFVGPTATEIVQDCIQLHGGIGVTWEHDAHLFLRRVSVNRMLHGTADEHLRRVADAALGVVA